MPAEEKIDDVVKVARRDHKKNQRQQRSAVSGVFYRSARVTPFNATSSSKTNGKSLNKATVQGGGASSLLSQPTSDYRT